MLSISRHTCSIAWDRPKEDGGTQILYYIIEEEKNDTGIWTECCKSASGREYSYRVTGLEENVLYRFSVTAVNKVGPGQNRCISDQCKTSGEICELFLLRHYQKHCDYHDFL